MSFNDVPSFLMRYKELKPPKLLLHKIVVELLREETNSTLSLGDVVVKNRCIYLETSPQLKGHILKNKNKIISQLRDVVGSSAPNDIK